MDPKKSNKIREIVRLQQILKKWKKLANASKNGNNISKTTLTIATTITSTSSTNNSNPTHSTTNNSGSKSIKFLKKTLSFSESSSSSSSISNDVVVPKGYLAVCVGKELKRFVIPTEYLGHKAFGILLREAEEEFGFQQEGVLKIPCEVAVFEKILKMMEQKTDVFFLHEFGFDADQKDMIMACYSSPDNCELTPSHHAQMCR